MTRNCEYKVEISRLKNRADFLRLRSGKHQKTRNMVVQMRPSTDAEKMHAARVGFTVTKKTGNAVERNRIKRRLRAASEQVFPCFSRAGHDYALIARRSCMLCDFGVLVADMEQALDRLHRNSAKGSDKSKKH